MWPFKKNKNQEKRKEHVPSNAEITMKAMQGRGAFEEDPKTADVGDKKSKVHKERKS